MSYAIYTTKGLVLSSRPLREADRVYSILTKDLGLIRATATGVRKEASKIRGAIEPLSLSSISLIKGKEYWRITSGEVLKIIPSESRILKPLALLERLVQGEAPNPELLDAIEEAILSDALKDEMFETRLVALILAHLGYLNKEDLNLDKKNLIKAINHGLEASNLNS